jgi:FdhD protein
MKKIEIIQFKKNYFEKLEDNVAEEAIAHIEINDEVSFDTIISPVGPDEGNDIKSYVYGNLFTEGFIRSQDEVLKYQDKRKDDIINVKLELQNFEARKKFLARNYNIIWTECGSLPELKRPLDKLERIETEIKLKPEDMFKIHDQIQDQTTLFKETGAYHYAFLFSPAIELVETACDIGRHNAVDKVIGKLLLTQPENKNLFEDKLLYTTGRISSDIVMKCLRAKLPVVISRGAPLKTAVELARRYNLGLVGFLRYGAKRFNVYSNEEIWKGEEG